MRPIWRPSTPLRPPRSTTSTSLAARDLEEASIAKHLLRRREGAYPALTTYLASSTIDAIEMLDFGSNPAEAFGFGFEAHTPPPTLTVKVAYSGAGL